MTIPIEVVERIASFIDPSVPTYCRLATVSRTFYDVFTSDKLWRNLDVYGLHNHIFQSFRTAFRENKSAELLHYAYFMFEGYEFEPRVLRTMTTNRFVWLGIILKFELMATYLKDYPDLMGVVCTVRPELICLDVFDIDKTKAIEVVSRFPYVIQYHKKLQRNQAVVKAAVRAPISRVTTCPFVRDGPVIQYVHPDLQKNHEIGSIAVEKDPRSLEFVSKDVQHNFIHNKQWILHAISLFPDWGYFYSLLPDNIDIFIHGFEYQYLFEEHSTPLLKYASERLQADEELCHLAVEVNPENVNYANCDKDCLLELHTRSLELLSCENSPESIDGEIKLEEQHLTQEYAELDPSLTREITLNRQMIKADPASYRDLCPDTQELELLAAEGYPIDVDWLNREFGWNKELVMKLIGCFDYSDGGDGAVLHVLVSWSDDKEVITRAVEQGLHPYFLDDISRTDLGFGSDRELMKLWIESSSSHHICEVFETFAKQALLEQVGEVNSNDYEIMKMLVAKCGCWLEFASERLQNDKEIVRAAFDSGPKIKPCGPYRFISDRLFNDVDFIRELTDLCGFAPYDYLDHADLALTTMRLHPELYPSIPEELRSSHEFNSLAVRMNAETLNFMASHQQIDRSLYTDAMFPRIKSVDKEKQRFCARCVNSTNYDLAYYHPAREPIDGDEWIGFYELDTR